MSPYAKAVEDARSVASKLGHDLAKSTEVAEGIGRIRCTRCNRSAYVRFYEPWGSAGAAVEEPCKDGTDREPLEPATPPILPPDGNTADAELKLMLESAEKTLGVPIVFARDDADKVPVSFGRRKARA